MCEGCKEIIVQKKPVIRQAAFKHRNDFVEVNELISIIHYKFFNWKVKQEGTIEVNNSFFHKIAHNAAIDEIKEAMEGMLSPDFKEEIVGTAEIRETFKISKVGTIAGCFVTEGKINRNNNVRVIRDGIVIYTGLLGSLKRFKDDVKEVQHNYECGLNIEKYNDIKVGDVVEAFEEVEVAKKL